MQQGVGEHGGKRSNSGVFFTALLTTFIDYYDSPSIPEGVDGCRRRQRFMRATNRCDQVTKCAEHM